MTAHIMCDVTFISNKIMVYSKHILQSMYYHVVYWIDISFLYVFIQVTHLKPYILSHLISYIPYRIMYCTSNALLPTLHTLKVAY